MIAAVMKENVDNELLSGYMTEAQFCAVVGRDKRTAARWRARREGPPFLKLGKSVLYRRASVLKWLESLEIATTARPRRSR